MSFKIVEKKCGKWNDYTMKVFPSLCNGDYVAMELVKARLVRRTTCGKGSVCDYAIYGDRDERLKDHAEYVDSDGGRRNK